MKKILNLSLVLIMIMALVGCVQSGGEPIVAETDILEVAGELNDEVTRSEEPKEEPREESVTEDLIVISIQDFSPNSATFIIENETDKELIYGDDFALQVLNEKNWATVECMNDIAFKSIGYNLPAQNRTKNIQIDWTNMYGALPDGKYRLVKSVSLEQEIYEVYDDFELNDAFAETDIPEVTEDIQGSEIKSTQAVHIVEDFTNETYVNFPEIINMIDYLEIDVDTVEKLSESNSELVFCFLDTSTGELLYDYVRQLESNDYEVELYDATISSTFIISTKDITIEITKISDIDAWKALHEEDYLDQITTENVFCKVFITE